MSADTLLWQPFSPVDIEVGVDSKEEYLLIDTVRSPDTPQQQSHDPQQEPHDTQEGPSDTQQGSHDLQQGSHDSQLDKDK